LEHIKQVEKIQEKERKKALATQLATAQKEIDKMGYQDYGQGAASQETQRSYEGPGGGYTGAGEATDWGGGEKEGGLIRKAQGGMINDPEYRGWKKMYETNPEIGSLHEKHPTFIKFYKKHERDRKQFGGLAGLLYG